MKLFKTFLSAVFIYLMCWGVYFASFFMEPAYPKDAGKNTLTIAAGSLTLSGACLIDHSGTDIIIKATNPLPRIHFYVPKDIDKSKMLRVRVENINQLAVKLDGYPVNVLEQGKNFIVFDALVEKEGELAFIWNKKDVSFIVWGDSQPSVSIFDGPAYVVFGKMLQLLKREKADFAIMLGDSVHGGDEWKFRRYIKQIKHLPFPVYHIPGNEEYAGKQGDSAYRKYFGDKTFQSFVIGHNLFVLLNTARGALSQDQLTWFLDLLAKTEEKTVFVFGHHPLWGPSLHANYVLHDKAQIEKIATRLLRFPRAWYIAGHIHGYYELSRNNIREIISGGGGAKLADNDNFHHYLKFNLTNGEASYSIVKNVIHKHLLRAVYVMLMLASLAVLWAVIYAIT